MLLVNRAMLIHNYTVKKVMLTYMLAIHTDVLTNTYTINSDKFI